MVTNYELFFNANKPEFIKELSRLEKTKLVEHIKKDGKCICLCCLCFYHKYDENNKLIGSGCSLEDGIEIRRPDKLYEDCPIWRNENDAGGED